MYLWLETRSDSFGKGNRQPVGLSVFIREKRISFQRKNPAGMSRLIAIVEHTPVFKGVAGPFQPVLQLFLHRLLQRYHAGVVAIALGDQVVPLEGIVLIVIQKPGPLGRGGIGMRCRHHAPDE